MRHDEALEIDRRRAEEAARALRCWTGVETMVVCAFKPDLFGRGWQPVGEQSPKDIARDDGPLGRGLYHLLGGDDDGTAKARTRKRCALGEVPWLATGLPAPVASPGRSDP